MKQIKQSSSFETPLTKSSPQIPKKPLVIPTVKRLHLPNQIYLDIAKLSIKNPIFFRIKPTDFEELLDEPEMKRVIKRNMKYFKGTKSCQFKSAPSFLTWKEACQFERSNLSAKRVLPEAYSKKTARFLRKIAKNRLIHRALVLNFTALDSNALQKVQYAKRLQAVRMLKVWSILYPVYERQSLDDELEGFFFLKNVGIFTNLQNLVIEFRHGNHKPETFYDIFEILSEVSPNLISLDISMSFSEVREEKGRNMKKILTKFTKLKCLRLNLNFEASLKNSGKIFKTIVSFKNLKYLNIKIDAKRHFDHSDIMKFIFTQKDLETLKLNCYHLFFNDYVELFGGIQKIKSLTNLCIIQREKNSYKFQYVLVFKTLEALKKLQSFKLDLGHCTFYPEDFRDVFKHLLKRPSLEKANIALPMAYRPDPAYCFDDELYGNIKRLRDKLRSFNVTVTQFGTSYPEFREMASKIIMPDGVVRKHAAFSTLDN